MRDFHGALQLREHPLGRAAGCGVDFLLVEHQWGRTDFEYSLPVRVDGTELPGIYSTIGYVPIEQGIDYIADQLIEKLRAEVGEG